MSKISRRHFLLRAGAVGLGFTGLASFVRAHPSDITGTIAGSNGFGPLKPDPQSVLDLPEGFSYRVISRWGDRMDDGFLIPHRPDGMATFPGPENLTILVRNHEVNPDAPVEEGPFGPENRMLPQLPSDLFFDQGKDGTPALGGTTTVLYDTHNQKVKRQFLSLTGTLRNCAGGPTPWNSWISCEESVQKADDRFAQDHGYCFEVPATSSAEIAQPVPLKSLGRFNHEAVAVDPGSGILYLTEDRHDGLLYRFLPREPGELQKGGTLQALKIRGEAGVDTRNWEENYLTPGEARPVEWINLENIQSPEDDLRHRGFQAGAARFARGEGMWYGDGAVYFACTNGGRKRKGQIWRYTPAKAEGRRDENGTPGYLELFVEPNDGKVIENADNLTVSPWGDLIVCEDGSGDQYLVGVTPEGGIYKFGRNAVNNSEFAGATFSPDGTTLFVNIQHAGLTLAITGPFRDTG